VSSGHALASALVKVTRSPQRRLADDTVAYHEAGHAVIAFFESIPIKRVSIVPGDEHRGHVKHADILRSCHPDADRSNRNRLRMERLVRMLLAGIVAQREYRPRSVRHWHSHSDYKNALECIDYFTTSMRETEAYANLLHIQVEQTLAREEVWFIVRRLAARFLEKRELFGREVVQVIHQAMQDACSACAGEACADPTGPLILNQGPPTTPSCGG
jgi:hypothetical protein